MLTHLVDGVDVGVAFFLALHELGLLALPLHLAVVR